MGPLLWGSQNELTKEWLSVDLDLSLHSRSMAYLTLLSLSLITYKTGIVIMSASKCYDD